MYALKYFMEINFQRCLREMLISVSCESNSWIVEYAQMMIKLVVSFCLWNRDEEGLCGLFSRRWQDSCLLEEEAIVAATCFCLMSVLCTKPVTNLLSLIVTPPYLESCFFQLADVCHTSHVAFPESAMNILNVQDLP